MFVTIIIALGNQSVSKTSETTNRMIFTVTKILVHFYKKFPDIIIIFHDFPWPWLFSMTFQAWKMVLLNSTTFQEEWSPWKNLNNKVDGHKVLFVKITYTYIKKDITNTENAESWLIKLNHWNKSKCFFNTKKVTELEILYFQSHSQNSREKQIKQKIQLEAADGTAIRKQGWKISWS